MPCELTFIVQVKLDDVTRWDCEGNPNQLLGQELSERARKWLAFYTRGATMPHVEVHPLFSPDQAARIVSAMTDSNDAAEEEALRNQA